VKQKALILNRFKMINEKPKYPYEAIYIYLYGYLCKFNKHIYTNNTLSKLLEPPGSYRRVKELIYRYRNNEDLWNKNTDIYKKLMEPLIQEKQEIELKNPRLNWEQIWKNWAGIKMPAIQS
jgi:hypothetical protein